MSNQPVRTCYVCREKADKKDLFRITKQDDKYIFDKNQNNQSRGLYICKTHQCVNRLSKNRKINLSSEDLYEMVVSIKKHQKNYLAILESMKQSDYLSFGMNMVKEDIKKIHLIIIAEDISDKNSQKIIRIARENSIKFLHYGLKTELGNICNKSEVNIIGIKNKKVVRGMI